MSEYLILPERSFQRHIDQDSGGKISAITLQRLAAEQKGCAKLFRLIKLLEHRVALGEAGQRPHVGLRVHGIAGLHHPHRGGEFFHESLVNVRMDDQQLCTEERKSTRLNTSP